jgi:antitoxin HicB
MRKTAANPHVGSTFEAYLREEGSYEATTARAIKRVLARQIKQAMKDGGFSKTEMARQMDTSRAALDRLLDPNNESVTLLTLTKAARIVGRQIKLELV